MLLQHSSVRLWRDKLQLTGVSTHQSKNNRTSSARHLCSLVHSRFSDKGQLAPHSCCTWDHGPIAMTAASQQIGPVFLGAGDTRYIKICCWWTWTVWAWKSEEHGRTMKKMVSSPPQSWTSKPTGLAFLYRDLVQCHDESTESPAENIPEVSLTNQHCNKIQDADLPLIYKIYQNTVYQNLNFNDWGQLRSHLCKDFTHLHSSSRCRGLHANYLRQYLKGREATVTRVLCPICGTLILFPFNGSTIFHVSCYILYIYVYITNI